MDEPRELRTGNLCSELEDLNLKISDRFYTAERPCRIETGPMPQSEEWQEENLFAVVLRIPEAFVVDCERTGLGLGEPWWDTE